MKYYEDGEWWEEIPMPNDCRDILKYLEETHVQSISESIQSVPANELPGYGDTTEFSNIDGDITEWNNATESERELDPCQWYARGKRSYRTTEPNSLDVR
jgi:hypothetical protein